MSSILEKIKTYGVKGIRDFLAGKLETRRMKRMFLENARRFPMTPAPGITVVAALGGQGSISKVARDFCFHLKKAGIPFQTFDLSSERKVAAEDVAPILTPREDFRSLKYDHIVEMFHSPFPDLPGVKRARIVFWEFESGLLEFDPRLDDGAQIVAMSDFNRDVFRKIFSRDAKRAAPQENNAAIQGGHAAPRRGSPDNVLAIDEHGDVAERRHPLGQPSAPHQPTTNKTPPPTVSKILYPFRFEVDGLPPADEMRAKYGIGADDFVVFYNFDLGSSYYRKNPEGALRAFAAAFAGAPRTMFAMKVMGAKKHAGTFAKLMALARELGVRDQVVAVTEYLPQKELYGLTNACDAYLSLHRGEGFGLGVAEAMSLGKAVVATDYSGTGEFCTPETALLVPYVMVDVKPEQIDNPNYRFVKTWAEPDVSAAAEALKRLHGDIALRQNLGKRAQAFVAEHFAMSRFAESVRNALDI